MSQILMGVCMVKLPSPWPCTPKLLVLQAAASWACWVWCQLPRLAAYCWTIPKHPWPSARWESLGCFCGPAAAVPSELGKQGRRGSRSCSCRQLLPSHRLNKGRPPQHHRSQRQAALASKTGEGTYPFITDQLPRRVFHTAEHAKPASLR